MKSSDHIIRPDVVCAVDDVMVLSVSYLFWLLFFGNQVQVLLNISEL